MTGQWLRSFGGVSIGSNSRAAWRIDGYKPNKPGPATTQHPRPSKHRGSKPAQGLAISRRRRHTKRARAARRKNRT